MTSNHYIHHIYIMYIQIEQYIKYIIFSFIFGLGREFDNKFVHHFLMIKKAISLKILSF